MAVEIKQVARRDQFENRLFFGFCNQPLARNYRTAPPWIEQRQKFTISRLPLGVDGKRIEIAPEAGQPHRLDGFAEQTTQRAIEIELACGDQFTLPFVR